MRILVCLKEVPDPDASVALDQADRPFLSGLPFVPNPYDENALEAAIQLKETHGAEVIALTLGPPEAERTVHRALAMGADQGVLVLHPTPQDLDGYASAAILAAAIRRLGACDLILCGREAADTSSGLVGPLLAQHLGIPFTTMVTKIGKTESGMRVERLSEGGYEVVETTLPALLTVSHQLNHPRYPSVMKMMQAKRRGAQLWKAEELVPGAPAVSAKYHMLRRYVPAVPGQCEIIPGATEDEKAKALVQKLVEVGVV